MSSTDSKKFLDLFNNVDEYKQVKKMKTKEFLILNLLLSRQYVRRLLMLFEHQIDYQLKILIK
jgi:hypothetical protein